VTPRPELRASARRRRFAAPALALLAASLAFSGCFTPRPRPDECRFGCRADCPHAERNRKADQLELGFLGAMLLTGALLAPFQDAPPPEPAPPPHSPPSASLQVSTSSDARRFSDQTRDRIAGPDAAE